MKKNTFLISFALMAAAFWMISCGHEKIIRQPLIPLEKGNAWKYTGMCNGEKVTVFMGVKEVLKRGRITYALVKGFPTDILEGGEWESRYWGLMSVGDQYYYRITGAIMDTLAKRIKNKNDQLTGLLSESQLYLVCAEDTGKIYGETRQITRDEEGYYWKVTEKSVFEATSIRGIVRQGPFDRFVYRYGTVPDETLLDVVPGIGIIRYRYCHHGKPVELDLRLTEVFFNHPGDHK